MTAIDDFKRTIENEFEDNGFSPLPIQIAIDGHGHPMAIIECNGREADGPPDLVRKTITAAKRDGKTVEQAFDEYNMFADAI